MTITVSLTKISSNTKTGPIPTTVTSRNSCPATCPFYDKGCYAKYGPAKIHWDHVTNGTRGSDWDALCQTVAKLSRGQLWRHNVAGDLPHHEGQINRPMLAQLAEASKGRKGWTYTHHRLTPENLTALADAKAKGFTVNLSTESVEYADALMSQHNLPAVAVVPSDQTERIYRTKSGRKVVTCPATIFDDITCAKCGICQQSDRDFIVAFPAHGTAKKTVNQIVGA